MLLTFQREREREEAGTMGNISAKNNGSMGEKFLLCKAIIEHNSLPLELTNYIFGKCIYRFTHQCNYCGKPNAKIPVRAISFCDHCSQLQNTKEIIPYKEWFDNGTDILSESFYCDRCLDRENICMNRVCHFNIQKCEINWNSYRKTCVSVQPSCGDDCRIGCQSIRKCSFCTKLACYMCSSCDGICYYCSRPSWS